MGMSTVGYGDISPVSTGGSLVTVILIIVSGLYLAIPIGIVGRSFAKVWEDRERLLLMQRLRDCVTRSGYTPADVQHMFDLLDVDGNGELDFEEFASMIELMQIGVSMTSVAQVFDTFDDDGAGSIDFREFLRALFPKSHRLIRLSLPHAAPGDIHTSAEYSKPAFRRDASHISLAEEAGKDPHARPPLLEEGQ